MASSAIVTCSPVESSMSISRRSGAEEIWRASARSPSVVLPIAETTTTIWLPGARRSRSSPRRRRTILRTSGRAAPCLPKPTRRVGASQSSGAPEAAGAGSRRTLRRRVGGLGEAHLLAEEVEPAEERDRQDLARVEQQGVADRRRMRDAEEPDREHHRRVEDADVARSGRDRDAESDEREHRPARDEG